MTAAEAAWAQLTAETLSGGSFKLLARTDRKDGGGGGVITAVILKIIFFLSMNLQKGHIF